MSTAKEAKAAAQGACSFGPPVWVSWTLHEDRSGRLRSGETIKDAFHALEGIPVSGVLANCCAPESITSAMPELASLPVNIVGGYANTFNPVPENWVLDTGTGMDENNMCRDDLDPEQYAGHVSKWIDFGANVVGGCCGTSPAHIAKLKQLIETKSIS
jgi:S-methylmethionine-dependent homocysteine/selenocysteine methylase